MTALCGQTADMDDAWEGTVVKKSRGLYDGSNMYRRLKIELTDGRTIKIRPSKDLWKSVSEGDLLIKAPGKEPAKKDPADQT